MNCAICDKWHESVTACDEICTCCLKRFPELKEMYEAGKALEHELEQEAA